MASDEAPRTATMTAILAESKKGKADGKTVSRWTVRNEIQLFATCSSKIWTLLPNVQEPTVEELDIGHLGLEEKSSLIFANSDLCNFEVCYFTCFFFLNSKSIFFS